MPRQARSQIAGLLWHMIHRENNRSVCFFDYYGYYLAQLQLHAIEHNPALISGQTLMIRN